MTAFLTGSGIAAIALIVGLVCWKRRAAPKATIVLYAIAGFGIGGGWIGNMLNGIGSTVNNIGQSLGSMLFGVGIPALALAVLVPLLVIDWKRGAKNRTTAWYALIIPALLAVPLALLGVPDMTGVLDSLPNLIQGR